MLTFFPNEKPSLVYWHYLVVIGRSKQTKGSFLSLTVFRPSAMHFTLLHPALQIYLDLHKFFDIKSHCLLVEQMYCCPCCRDRCTDIKQTD